MALTAEYFKNLLLTIYPAKIDFSVTVTTKRAKTLNGYYCHISHRICIHTGWGNEIEHIDTAIHEYAHHIHYSEKEAEKLRQKPHGKEFKTILSALKILAKLSGVYQNKIK